MISNDFLKQVVDYFGLLFDKDEHVWAASNVRNKHLSMTKIQSIDLMFDKAFPDGSFLAINGCKEPGVNKQSDNVKTFRNFLIEFDKMPLEQQIPYMDSTGIPYSACVYSGGKSYHFIISLDEPVNNILEYKDIFYRIHHLCQEKNDKACSDPARFTRFPNSIRANKRQLVIKINKRVSKQELLARLNTTDFLESYKKTSWYGSFVEVSEFMQDFVTNDRERQSVIDKIDWYTNSYLGKNWSLGKKMFVQCPVCREEGRDNHHDNMHIHGNKALFNCFADPDHNPKILSSIFNLMKDLDLVPEKTILEVKPVGQLIDWSKVNV